MKKIVRGFSQNGCISRSGFLVVLSRFFLLTPRCSSAVGSVWPCAWARRTVRSCSSPGWWRSVTTGRCRSRCSTGGGRHRPPRAGRPRSSWRWWWPGWGQGCTTMSCPSLRHGSPEARMTGMQCSTQARVKLWRESGKADEKIISVSSKNRFHECVVAVVGRWYKNQNI